MIGELVEEYAIGSVLSDSAGMGYTAFAEELEKDNIPREVVVYKPYENLYPLELLEVLEDYYGVFETFAERLIEKTNIDGVSGGAGH